MSRQKARTIMRRATRKSDEPLNILSFPTHERYQTNIAKTGHNFYLWQGEGIKPWVESYAPVPANTSLLNPSKKDKQIPIEVDVDLILSQNKFGQFQIASKLADYYDVPMISLEHTLPVESWNYDQRLELYQMRGSSNVFISEYSRKEWGWNEGEACVVHHGIDTELFSPGNGERKPRALSVVNDWIQRDWCCGYKLWETVTGFPNSPLFDVHVVGDTPGLSIPATSTEELVEEYRKSRVFLNTSTVSPVPTALLEAMSCGCAVVTTENCMIPEIIQNGVNGYMSNDHKQLRDYTQKLLGNKRLSKKLGDNARKTIVENFGLQDFITNWNNIFSISCAG